MDEQVGDVGGVDAAYAGGLPDVARPDAAEEGRGAHERCGTFPFSGRKGTEGRWEPRLHSERKKPLLRNTGEKNPPPRAKKRRKNSILV